jgi:hypothetical protein
LPGENLYLASYAPHSSWKKWICFPSTPVTSNPLPSMAKSQQRFCQPFTFVVTTFILVKFHIRIASTRRQNFLSTFLKYFLVLADGHQLCLFFSPKPRSSAALPGIFFSTSGGPHRQVQHCLRLVRRRARRLPGKPGYRPNCLSTTTPLFRTTVIPSILGSTFGGAGGR